MEMQAISLTSIIIVFQGGSGISHTKINCNLITNFEGLLPHSLVGTKSTRRQEDPIDSLAGLGEWKRKISCFTKIGAWTTPFVKIGQS